MGSAANGLCDFGGGETLAALVSGHALATMPTTQAMTVSIDAFNADDMAAASTQIRVSVQSCLATRKALHDCILQVILRIVIVNGLK